ncbi:MAG: hypothetical protein ACD_62C00356G0001 [uncultured bacterium]|nr:MAG: hypothetical protein ACD_62C00356G0001 [uncultured bacterium]
MDDYWNYARDFVAVYKAKAPHVQPRIYDFFDEVDLNTEAGNAGGSLTTHVPYWSTDDVVDWAQQGKEFIEEHDPGAIVIGPQHTGSLRMPDLNFLEEVLEAGLLDYIDGYSLHAYHTPPAEDSHVLERLREIKALLRQYNEGEDFPIHQTETGYCLNYPNRDALRDHASWHVRLATILKGEGVVRHYVFYEIDVLNLSNAYGLNFNLDPELRHGDWPRAPKPAVPALAVAAKMLEGYYPVEDFIDQAQDRWGYRLSDGVSSVVVVWDPHGTQTMDVSVGGATTVTEVDMMGHETQRTASGGSVSVAIGPSPKYIVYDEQVATNDATSPQQASFSPAPLPTTPKPAGNPVISKSPVVIPPITGDDDSEETPSIPDDAGDKDSEPVSPQPVINDEDSEEIPANLVDTGDADPEAEDEGTMDEGTKDENTMDENTPADTGTDTMDEGTKDENTMDENTPADQSSESVGGMDDFDGTDPVVDTDEDEDPILAGQQFILGGGGWSCALQKNHSATRTDSNRVSMLLFGLLTSTLFFLKVRRSSNGSQNDA